MHADASKRQKDQHTQHVDDDASLKQPIEHHRDRRESASSCSTTAGPHSPKSNVEGDAQVYIPSHSRRSIYDLYSPRRRNTILLAAAFSSILVPFSDTIYLPALAVSYVSQCQQQL